MVVLLPERMLIQSLYTYWLPLFLAPYLPLYFVKMPFFCPFYLKFCPFLKCGSYDIPMPMGSPRHFIWDTLDVDARGLCRYITVQQPTESLGTGLENALGLIYDERKLSIVY